MPEELEPIEDTVYGCFGCGVDNTVGLQLKFFEKQGHVQAHTRLERRFAGYSEFAHGGVVATLLDEAMGWALLHIVGRYGVTRDLKVSYRRPVYLGRDLTLIGEPHSVDREVAILESRLLDHRGRLLASARGHWVLVRDARGDGNKTRIQGS